jgi:hypothetical protein
MPLLLTLTYSDRAGETRFGIWPPPRVADDSEIERVVRGPVETIRRNGGRDILLAVTDDVSSGCLARYRMRSA